jgi:hypothetical protein
VFAAQSESHFTGNSSEDLVGRVNHKPLVRHVSGFGAERFGHEFSLLKRVWRLFSTVGVSLLETS